MNRTDCHRPSVIEPSDYEFVGCEVMRIDDIGAVYAMQEERARIRAHMERTGGTYSRHAHGGNCAICGNANAIYTVLFWHEPTNTYVRAGQECADKMDCGDAAMFRRLNILRDGVQAARVAKAGKAKAQAILTEEGMSLAWDVYTSEPAESDLRAHYIVRDIVGKLVAYGHLSDKQTAFLRLLVDEIERAPEIQAKRQAEHDAADPVPVDAGRVTVCAKLLAIKAGDFGDRMLVQADAGYKLFGSLPASLCDVERGDRIQFTAAVRPSDRDAKFGFFSRPTKAVILERR